MFKSIINFFLVRIMKFFRIIYSMIEGSEFNYWVLENDEYLGNFLFN